MIGHPRCAADQAVAVMSMAAIFTILKRIPFHVACRDLFREAIVAQGEVAVGGIADVVDQARIEFVAERFPVGRLPLDGRWRGSWTSGGRRDARPWRRARD
jgi:hypothetical protein